MKRTKKLYILLGVLVVICIATFALSKTEEKKENIKNSDKTVLEVDSDSVNKISWKSSSGSLAFEKKDGTWTYTDDANFPVDQDKIAERLKLFKEFGVAFEIEDVDDYGQYGLDDPECTITLETDDETYEISLGDYSTMDSQRYVSIGDGNVYLVKNDPMDSFNVTIDALVKNDEIPNFNQVEKISEIKVSGSTSLDAKYKENDGLSDNEDDIYFVNKDKEEQPLDTNLVKTYLNNVNALNLGTYVTYNATDEELAKYGLDEPRYNLEVKYTPKSEDSSEDSGDSTDLEAGSSEKTFILHVSAKQDDKAYVRIGDSKIIYEIPEDEYKNVTDGSYDSLRHKSVVTADLSDVDSVKVTLEDKDYTIDLSEKKGDVVSTYDGEEIEGTDFTDALKALKASDFTSEEPSEKEEISFTLHYKDDKYPEKEVKIYRYDGTNCLVTIDGKSISLVKRNLVVDLTEAVNAIVLK